MIYSFSAIYKKNHTIQKKKTMETRIIKNICNKDVGMSKPKKHANKVGKLNKPLPYNPT